MGELVVETAPRERFLASDLGRPGCGLEFCLFPDPLMFSRSPASLPTQGPDLLEPLVSEPSPQLGADFAPLPVTQWTVGPGASWWANLWVGVTGGAGQSWLCCPRSWVGFPSGSVVSRAEAWAVIQLSLLARESHLSRPHFSHLENGYSTRLAGLLGLGRVNDCTVGLGPPCSDRR